jgi:RNA polymerase-binding transcription factor DksA
MDFHQPDDSQPCDMEALEHLISRSRSMKKADMKVYKERLLLLRARLRGDVNQLADAALNKSRKDSSGDLSSLPSHIADLGSDNFEQEFTLSLMQTEEGTLDAIENALHRIEDKTFSLCEECGGNITKSRLNAIPYTPYCIKCAEQFEQG